MTKEKLKKLKANLKHKKPRLDSRGRWENSKCRWDIPM
ncbi:hypothetical protein GXM_04237 [Nostoc sphaeroides CCNUC1]|uniref:Uncharacterized protein n=1 Tax=Nostoc sphaeroides CCNUC1 TaxID=2653204 RepID=A0A5P8W3A3_9NOSO|nr:hypothetical protein GXM_04237 [Nostoc sphaeroides CCNUC1]